MVIPKTTVKIMKKKKIHPKNLNFDETSCTSCHPTALPRKEPCHQTALPRKEPCHQKALPRSKPCHQTVLPGTNVVTKRRHLGTNLVTKWCHLGTNPVTKAKNFRVGKDRSGWVILTWDGMSPGFFFAWDGSQTS